MGRQFCLRHENLTGLDRQRWRQEFVDDNWCPVCDLSVSVLHLSLKHSRPLDIILPNSDSISRTGGICQKLIGNVFSNVEISCIATGLLRVDPLLILSAM